MKPIDDGLLIDFLKHELSPAQAHELQKALAQDQRLQERLHSYQKLFKLLRTLPNLKVDPAFKLKLQNQITEPDTEIDTKKTELEALINVFSILKLRPSARYTARLRAFFAQRSQELSSLRSHSISSLGSSSFFEQEVKEEKTDFPELPFQESISLPSLEISSQFRARIQKALASEAQNLSQIQSSEHLKETKSSSYLSSSSTLSANRKISSRKISSLPKPSLYRDSLKHLIRDPGFVTAAFLHLIFLVIGFLIVEQSQSQPESTSSLAHVVVTEKDLRGFSLGENNGSEPYDFPQNLFPENILNQQKLQERGASSQRLLNEQAPSANEEKLQASGLRTLIQLQPSSHDAPSPFPKHQLKSQEPLFPPPHSANAGWYAFPDAPTEQEAISIQEKLEKKASSLLSPSEKQKPLLLQHLESLSHYLIRSQLPDGSWEAGLYEGKLTSMPFKAQTPPALLQARATRNTLLALLALYETPLLPNQAQEQAQARHKALSFLLDNFENQNYQSFLPHPELQTSYWPDIQALGTLVLSHAYGRKGTQRLKFALSQSCRRLLQYQINKENADKPSDQGGFAYQIPLKNQKLHEQKLKADPLTSAWVFQALLSAQKTGWHHSDLPQVLKRYQNHLLANAQTDHGLGLGIISRPSHTAQHGDNAVLSATSANYCSEILLDADSFDIITPQQFNFLSQQTRLPSNQSFIEPGKRSFATNHSAWYFSSLAFLAEENALSKPSASDQQARQAYFTQLYKTLFAPGFFITQGPDQGAVAAYGQEEEVHGRVFSSALSALIISNHWRAELLAEQK